VRIAHEKDPFPCPLYRAFLFQNEANDFIEHGIVKLGNLTVYHNIEDKIRRDKSEGDGGVTFFADPPNESVLIHYGTSSANVHYIYCFSGPRVDLNHLKSFGSTVIRINQPNKFVCDITYQLEQHPKMYDVIMLDCVPVRYDKDLLVNNVPEQNSLE